MGNITDGPRNFQKDAANGVHMPHWMTHGTPMTSRCCCAWVQLGGSSAEQCQACDKSHCPEAVKYAEEHYDELMEKDRREQARRRMGE